MCQSNSGHDLTEAVISGNSNVSVKKSGVLDTVCGLLSSSKYTMLLCIPRILRDTDQRYRE